MLTTVRRLALRAIVASALASTLSGCETLASVADFGLTMAAVAIDSDYSSNSAYSYASTPSYSSLYTTSYTKPKTSSYTKPSTSSYTKPAISSYTTPATSRYTSNTSPSRPSSSKRSRSAQANSQYSLISCVTFDRNSNSIADFAINRCNKKLNVRWSSDGHCRGGRCATTVGAYGKQSISKNKGRIRYAVCVYPEIVTNWNGNGSKYNCQ